VESQRTWLDAAAARGRSDLSILLGIPTEEVLTAYLPFKDMSDALLELESSRARDLPRCRVWAPVWTRSIPDESIALMHGSNRQVYVWTVDLREGILRYLPRVDGILSNYPTLVRALRDAGY
jgi:glycerophosphoryl diester phosphodiesterase